MMYSPSATTVTDRPLEEWGRMEPTFSLVKRGRRLRLPSMDEVDGKEEVSEIV